MHTFRALQSGRYEVMFFEPNGPTSTLTGYMVVANVSTLAEALHLVNYLNGGDGRLGEWPPADAFVTR